MTTPLQSAALRAVADFCMKPGRPPAEAAAALLTASVAMLEAQTDSGHTAATLRAIFHRLGLPKRRQPPA